MSVLNNINEGIDFNRTLKTISYNPSHENNVDTSFSNNPTLDNDVLNGVEVWSIFKRKHGSRGDGNPLIYAFKQENGWTFNSKKDKQLIISQFKQIADKFVKLYPFDVTIVLPSSNPLNEYINKIISAKIQNISTIRGFIRKLTTIEAYDMVLDFNSEFRKHYKDNFEEALNLFESYLERMDIEKSGNFSRHLIRDMEMRKVCDFTFKLSEDIASMDASKINEKHVLILDDTISNGDSIRHACKIIKENYSPKSITGLTLLSKLY